MNAVDATDSTQSANTGVVAPPVTLAHGPSAGQATLDKAHAPAEAASVARPSDAVDSPDVKSDSHQVVRRYASPSSVYSLTDCTLRL